jgi:hypothetical protein
MQKIPKEWKKTLIRTFKRWGFRILLLIIALNALYVFWIIINFFLSFLVPWYISYTVFAALLYWVGGQVCRMLAFPGSTFLWRRQTENAMMQ